MIVWRNSTDFRRVSFPEQAARWKRRLGYHQVESRPCGEITVTTYHLPLPETIPAPGKMIFLTDLHYRNAPAWNARLRDLEKALDQLQPDFLLLGGDVVADAVDLPDLPEMLRRLRRHTNHAFAIPGNWEQGKYWLPREYWENLYRSCGIEWLANRTIRSGTLCISGVEDLRGTPRCSTPQETNCLNILLAHRPDTAIQLDHQGGLPENCHLILSGHLHGGQVRLPLFGSISGHSLYGRKFDYGLYQKQPDSGTGSPYMIVSSGLGELSFPFRFGCRREIVEIVFRKI